MSACCRPARWKRPVTTRHKRRGCCDIDEKINLR